MANQLCIVLDFGGQYNQLIARRVRECGVYCEIKSYQTPLEEIKALAPDGIIFTGGPNSVYDMSSPHISKEIFESILGASVYITSVFLISSTEDALCAFFTRYNSLAIPVDINKKKI